MRQDKANTVPEPIIGKARRGIQSIEVGGQLLLATPFSWLQEFTPEKNWLGGTEDAAPSHEVLADLLRPAFTLEFTKDLPFLIREHSRKFQYGISLGTRWHRH